MMQLPQLVLVVSSAIGLAQAAPQPAEPSQLKRKIDEMLIKELTQHWYPHAVDRQRGGFHQNLARDWSFRVDDSVLLGLPVAHDLDRRGFRAILAAPPC